MLTQRSVAWVIPRCRSSSGIGSSDAIRPHSPPRNSGPTKAVTEKMHSRPVMRPDSEAVPAVRQKVCLPGRDSYLPNCLFRTVRQLSIDNHRQPVRPSERNYSDDARLWGFGVIERYDVSAQPYLPVVSASGFNLFPDAGFGVKFLFHLVCFLRVLSVSSLDPVGPSYSGVAVWPA